MDVIVKGSPSIEISFESKVIKVEGGGGPSDSPFEKGEGENSAVQKGGNNASTAKLSSAKGLNNSSLGWYSNSEGYGSTSISEHLDIEALGQYTPDYSADRTKEIKDLIYDKYIERKNQTPSGDNLFSAAYGLGSHTEGRNGLSLGQRAHTEGLDNIGYGHNSHAEGQGNEAKGNNSHAEGYSNVSEGRNAHVEGNHNIASGENSHAEGSYMISDGKASHAEGLGTEKYEYGAFGNYSHHEGGYNKVTNSYAHGEGANNEANGLASHVEGRYNIADGHFSHSEGKYTQTTTDAEHAQGIYNLSNEKTIHSVGIGDKNERKNAHEIMQDGKHYIYDIGGYKGTNPTDSEDLATVINNKADKNELDGLSNDIEERIADEIANLVDSASETLNTLNELAEAIQENEDVIDALNSAITNKVDKVEGKDLSTNDYTDEDKEKLSSIEEGAQKNVASDWNASEGESGYIKSRTHYVSGAHSIPFEYWNKSIDENGDAIYSYFAGYDLCYGCIIRDGNYVFGEENYIFFETEWVSLYPAVSANIRINYDSEVGDSVLEIKLHQDADPEEYLANFINNALFAYGQGEDFIYPIAKEFIPNTIARQEEVDEVRDETVALWENVQTHDEKLNEVEAKIGSEEWDGVFIIKINSITLNGTTSTYVAECYNKIKATLDAGKQLSVFLIDESLDVPNVAIVESIAQGNNNVTLTQVRPSITTSTLLLMGYTFHSGGFFESLQSVIAIPYTGGFVDLGSNLNPTSSGIDISSQYTALFNVANKFYSSQPCTFAVKLNYTVLHCIGVKSVDSGANFEAYFISNDVRYRIVIGRTNTTATLYKD